MTMTLRIIPKRKPEKLPLANSMPAVEPSPTGKANSQPSSSIIGTSGIRKKELTADMRLAQKSESVLSRG